MKKIDIERNKRYVFIRKTYRRNSQGFGTYYQTIARKLKTPE